MKTFILTLLICMTVSSYADEKDHMAYSYAAALTMSEIIKLTNPKEKETPYLLSAVGVLFAGLAYECFQSRFNPENIAYNSMGTVLGLAFSFALDDDRLDKRRTGHPKD